MGNTLQKLLQERKVEILAKWEDSILGAYAPDAFHIFKNQKDQFANPIGHKVRVGLAEFFDVLCEASDEEVLTPDLQDLIKLRAVQQVSAADAVAFVFKLKEIVRRELPEKGLLDAYREWAAFDARVDAAALAVFDMFMVSKEQLYKVRIDEFRHGRSILTDAAVCPSALARRNGQNGQAGAGISLHADNKAG
jgi:hypothetical protein